MTTAEKIARAKTDFDEVYTAGYTKGKAEGGGGGITPSGEIEITENNKTYDVTQYASARVNVAASGGELPTLFTPSISLANGETEISIIDGNGGFVEKYEVYIDGAKVGEVVSKNFVIADMTASNETIEIFVKAVAELFNASGNSNVVVREIYQGTAGLSYTLSGDGTYYTCNGIGTAVETDIVIADEYNGLPVKYISNFDYNSTITSVVVPKHITVQPYKVFASCTALKSAIIKCAWTLATSDSNAFDNCRNLTSVDLGPAPIIGGYMFTNCSALPNIVIPHTVTAIGRRAFSGCSKLEYIDLTAYGTSITFPTLADANAFQSAGTSTAAGTFEIRVASGRKAELAAMTNWSSFADNIVEV